MGKGCLDCCRYFNAQRQTKDTGYSVLSSNEPVLAGSVLDVVVEPLACISLPEGVGEAFIHTGNVSALCVRCLLLCYQSLWTAKKRIFNFLCICTAFI